MEEDLTCRCCASRSQYDRDCSSWHKEWEVCLNHDEDADYLSTIRPPPPPGPRPVTELPPPRWSVDSSSNRNYVRHFLTDEIVVDTGGSPQETDSSYRTRHYYDGPAMRGYELHCDYSCATGPFEVPSSYNGRFSRKWIERGLVAKLECDGTHVCGRCLGRCTCAACPPPGSRRIPKKNKQCPGSPPVSSAGIMGRGTRKVSFAKTDENNGSGAGGGLRPPRSNTIAVSEPSRNDDDGARRDVANRTKTIAVSEPSRYDPDVDQRRGSHPKPSSFPLPSPEMVHGKSTDSGRERSSLRPLQVPEDHEGNEPSLKRSFYALPPPIPEDHDRGTQSSYAPEPISDARGSTHSNRDQSSYPPPPPPIPEDHDRGKHSNHERFSYAPEPISDARGSTHSNRDRSSYPLPPIPEERGSMHSNRGRFSYTPAEPISDARGSTRSNRDRSSHPPPTTPDVRRRTADDHRYNDDDYMSGGGQRKRVSIPYEDDFGRWSHQQKRFSTHEDDLERYESGGGGGGKIDQVAPDGVYRSSKNLDVADYRPHVHHHYYDYRPDSGDDGRHHHRDYANPKDYKDNKGYRSHEWVDTTDRSDRGF